VEFQGSDQRFVQSGLVRGGWLIEFASKYEERKIEILMKLVKEGRRKLP